jgi:DNA-binding beta-propeller fold protein YncE
MSWKTITGLLVLTLLIGALADPAIAKKKKKKKGKESQQDPYASYVWPPLPDEPRIKLEAILTGRSSVEAKSRFKRMLLGASPRSRYDRLRKPFAVAFDPQGRILVTDWETRALIRFDRVEGRMDVLGTRSSVRLRRPMGLDVTADGIIFVADAELRKVVAFDSEGKVKAVYGGAGELVNPTDAAVSPDGSRVYVADSKAHQIAIFEAEGGGLLRSFGGRGVRGGEFAFPTSLTFGPEGNLFVVDQLNSRVQMLDPDGEYLDHFGDLGVGFGNFVRPKDVAVDDVGFIYVTDNAFNNIQLFDIDFALLTFIGVGGTGPGQFDGISGVAVRGDSFAVVEQLGHRVQIFRFIVPRSAD